ncbi:hypothetical protein [Cycloclasticus pugetii]|uniref:hypothetical protein n=1 Tax=Cycloclasticus pugetii TaxID=34068 RepID=UPI003A92DFD2
MAQKKIDQMGGVPVGLLVQNEAGAYAAVDEHGRVMWLDSWGVAAEPDSAYGESIKQRASAWLELCELLDDTVPEWRNHPGTGKESALFAIKNMAKDAHDQGQGACRCIGAGNGCGCDTCEPSEEQAARAQGDAEPVAVVELSDYIHLSGAKASQRKALKETSEGSIQNLPEGTELYICPPSAGVPEGQFMLPKEFLIEYRELVEASDFRPLHKLARVNAIDVLLAESQPPKQEGGQ